MKTNISKWPGILLLLFFIALGLFLHEDYGISYDEFAQHRIGTINYNYVFHNDNELETFFDKAYGVGFELPLIILERGLKLTDNHDIFLMRHLVTHLFFLLCMFVGYLLSLRLFQNQWIACFTFIMLVLEPRIYPHTFYNTKDIPSLSTLLLCFYLSARAFEKQKSAAYLLLGICVGYAISIRLMNVIITGPLYIFLLYDFIKAIIEKRRVKTILSNALLLTIGCVLTMYICWPYLWKDPVHNLIEAFTTFSKFRWEGHVLLNGTVISALQLPWYYIPEWFSITVPLIWLLTGLGGVAYVLSLIVTKRLKMLDHSRYKNYLLYLFCFAAPVAMVIVLNSVLYDDWRHLYFIYPAFILLASLALYKIWQTRTKWPVLVLYAAQLILVIVFFVRWHPYQNVYFNELISRKPGYLMQHFELDYWGHSYKAGLEWIAANDSRDSIYVNYNIPLRSNVDCLPADIRKRLIVTEEDSLLDYNLQNFRTSPYQYDIKSFEITVMNSPILRVSKLK